LLSGECWRGADPIAQTQAKRQALRPLAAAVTFEHCAQAYTGAPVASSAGAR